MTRIALVACSARKGISPQPALTLYRGELFKLSVAWAQRHGYDVWVLSAKHHLIHASDVIEPYNLKLVEKNLGPWSCRVDGRFRDLELQRSEEIVVLAGDLYRRWLECRNARRCPRWPVTYPLRGMGIGEQKAWLSEQPVVEQRELFT